MLEKILQSIVSVTLNPFFITIKEAAFKTKHIGYANENALAFCKVWGM